MADALLQSGYLRSLAVGYARAFLGTPYRWGGDDPIFGFDCSGLVHEILQAVGLERHKFDSSADEIWLRLRKYEVAEGYAGCLVFWLTPAGRAVHVEFLIDDRFSIGASGGGSGTTSQAAAAEQNAFVKMRPVNYRGDGYHIVDPFKLLE